MAPVERDVFGDGAVGLKSNVPMELVKMKRSTPPASAAWVDNAINTLLQPLPTKPLAPVTSTGLGHCRKNNAGAVNEL